MTWDQIASLGLAALALSAALIALAHSVIVDRRIERRRLERGRAVRAAWHARRADPSSTTPPVWRGCTAVEIDSIERWLTDCGPRAQTHSDAQGARA